MDRPSDTIPAVLRNTTTHQDNFLYHIDILYRFITFLAIERPGARQPEILRHFYWNVWWEAYFEPGPASSVRVTRTVHDNLSVQRRVHSGAAADARFHGREFAPLPMANDLARHGRAIITTRADWSAS